MNWPQYALLSSLFSLKAVSVCTSKHSLAHGLMDELISVPRPAAKSTHHEGKLVLLLLLPAARDLRVRAIMREDTCIVKRQGCKL